MKIRRRLPKKMSGGDLNNISGGLGAAAGVAGIIPGGQLVGAGLGVASTVASLFAKNKLRKEQEDEQKKNDQEMQDKQIRDRSNTILSTFPNKGVSNVQQYPTGGNIDGDPPIGKIARQTNTIQFDPRVRKIFDDRQKREMAKMKQITSNTDSLRQDIKNYPSVDEIMRRNEEISKQFKYGGEMKKVKKISLPMKKASGGYMPDDPPTGKATKGTQKFYGSPMLTKKLKYEENAYNKPIAESTAKIAQYKADLEKLKKQKSNTGNTYPMAIGGRINRKRILMNK